MAVMLKGAQKEPVPKWTIREQLILASSVQRSGDQNWVSVSRAIKPLVEESRTPEYFSQKNCAIQYAAMLDKSSMPKRKRKEDGASDIVETVEEQIVRHLTGKRIKELDRSLSRIREEYTALKKEIEQLERGELDSQLQTLWEEAQTETSMRLSKSPPLKKVTKGPADSIETVKDAANDSMSFEEDEESPFISKETTSSQQLISTIKKEQSEQEKNATNGGVVPITPQTSAVSQASIVPEITASEASNISQPGHVAQTSISQPTNVNQTSVPQPSNVQPLNVTQMSISRPLNATQLQTSISQPTNVVQTSVPQLSNVQPLNDTQTSISQSLNVTQLQTSISQPLNVTHTSVSNATETSVSSATQTNVAQANNVPQVKAVSQSTVSQANIVSPLQVTTSSRANTAPPLMASQAAVSEAITVSQASTVSLSTASTVSQAGSVSQTSSVPVSISIPSSSSSQVPESEIESRQISSPPSETAPTTNEETVETKAYVDTNSKEALHVEHKENAPIINAADGIPAADNVSVKKESPIKKEKPTNEATTSSKLEDKMDSALPNEEMSSLKEENKEPEDKGSLVAKEQEQETNEEIIVDVESHEETKKETNQEDTPTSPDTPLLRKRKKQDLLELETPSLRALKSQDSTKEEETVRVRRGRPPGKRRGRGRPRVEHQETPPCEEESEEENLSAMSSAVPSPCPSQGDMDPETHQSFRNWRKTIMLVWRHAAQHKYANLFLHPVKEEDAPGYYDIVLRPMDLTTIKKNIETGVIRTDIEFQRDMLLMFQNAFMYNSSDHDVYKMAEEMRLDVMENIQEYLLTQMMVQSSSAKALRSRETKGSEEKTSKRVDDPSPARKKRLRLDD